MFVYMCFEVIASTAPMLRDAGPLNKLAFIGIKKARNSYEAACKMAEELQLSTENIYVIPDEHLMFAVDNNDLLKKRWDKPELYPALELSDE